MERLFWAHRQYCPWSGILDASPTFCHPERSRGILAPNGCCAAAAMRRSFDALRLLRMTGLRLSPGTLTEAPVKFVNILLRCGWGT